MKLGIILFIIGSILALYLSQVKLEKRVIKRIGIAIGFVLAIYGLILIVQPNEEAYVKYNLDQEKSSKEIEKTNKD